MINKDDIPMNAVSPSESQRKFFARLMQETSDYARSKNYSDMHWKGHDDLPYFGAYSSELNRRGSGLFIFGIDRRGEILRFAFPIDIIEPYRLAKSWTGDPSRNRAIIEIQDDLDEEMQLYFIELGKRSIDFHYGMKAGPQHMDKE